MQKQKTPRRAGNCSVGVAWRGLELTVEHVPLAGRSDDDDAYKDNDGDMDDLWYYRSSNKITLEASEYTWRSNFLSIRYALSCGTNFKLVTNL